MLFEEPIVLLLPSSAEDDLSKDSLPVLTWNRRSKVKKKGDSHELEDRRRREKTKFEVRNSDSEKEEGVKTSTKKKKGNLKERGEESKVKRKTENKEGQGKKELVDQEVEPFHVSTAREEALGRLESDQKNLRKTRGEKPRERRQVELASVREIRREIRRNQVEFIAFIEIEPVQGIKEEILGKTEKEEQEMQPSERI
ncbi:hypothetical protein CSUI_005186 [Cystoisospora suis]|uniref:Uncharacterized protein n=1 Tax=Cystoisospora suis TaxID=483139 RepID=A0A2C6KYD7_9APIC|nr:hypothetical protein CSUI_005186 [Cystoisospora suis]